MRSSAARRSRSVIVPRETSRARCRSMLSSPALILSRERSFRRTFMPASAQTCAMPVPICPAPMIPTVWISGVIATPRQLTPDLRQLFLEFRQDLEQVADETVIGDLEDRRFFVLVDGHDDFRVLHPG